MTTAEVLPIAVYNKQAEYIDSRAWITGFCAGRGAGKTKVASQKIILNAKDGDPYICVSPSYVVLEDTTWPTFEETCDQMGVLQKTVKSPLPRITFRTQDGGKANIVFRSGEEPESLRGPSKAGGWLDEPGIMHHDVFKIIIPVLRHRGRMGPLDLTFTPKGKKHWTYGVFFERKGEVEVQRPKTKLIRAHTRDNPFLPEEFYDNIRGHYTSALAAQELEAEFVDLSGLMFLREWFLNKFVDGVPLDCDRVRYWDKASSHQSGCYTAGVLMARSKTDGRFFVENVVRGQWSAHERNQVMLATAERDKQKYRGQVHVFVEQEPGSGGKESMDITIREMAEFGARRDIVSRGKRERTVGKEKLPGEAKIVRAQPFAAQCEAGNVYILRAKWTEDYLEELIAFPEYAYADQVDGSSGSFNKLTKMFGYQHSVIPHRGATERPESEEFGVQAKTMRETQQERGWFRRSG